MSLVQTKINDYLSKEFNVFSENLAENLGIGICDEFVHSAISRCVFRKYEKVLNYITGQKPILSMNPMYSMYKVNILTKVASNHLEHISGDIHDQYYSSIQSDGEHIIFNN
jgi:hypothetical protein